MVDLDEKLVTWLSTVMPDLIRGTNNLFVGKTRSGELDLMVNIKNNREGISLLFTPMLLVEELASCWYAFSESLARHQGGGTFDQNSGFYSYTVVAN